MVSAIVERWSEIFSNPLRIGIVVYLIIGFLIVAFIISRGLKLRQPPNNGLLWDKKDHARNVLFLFQTVILSSPVIWLLEIALWPLLILFIWPLNPMTINHLTQRSSQRLLGEITGRS
jgi:hypothetical protein